MADERSLTDLVRFLDPSGSMGDADIANVTQKMKFTDVLDVITNVSKGNDTDARTILAKYDDRFKVTNEYSSVPTAPKTSGFKPIKPIGTSQTPNGPKPNNPNGANSTQQKQQDDETEELDQIIHDPQNQNSPEVKQIQSLVQRIRQR